MSLAAVLFEPIEARDRAILIDQLSQCRRRAIQERLDGLLGAMTGAESEHHAAVSRFCQDLLRVVERDPEQLWTVLDQWAHAFALHRIVAPPAQEPAWRSAVANLATLHLLDALDRSGEDARGPWMTTVNDRGGLLDLRGLARIQLPFPPGTTVVWTREEGQVVARADAHPGAVLRFSAPLRGRAASWYRPLPMARGWQIPIVESGHEAGMDEDRPGVEPSPPLLPLAESLPRAHALVASVFPDAVQWAQTLIPAFVSLGVPPNLKTNRSESYQAGEPIFLALTTDPAEHAEAVIHELQHHRFRLFDAYATPFAGTRDPDYRFISPFQAGPRRLWGLHLALHAFVAVNELHLRCWRRGLQTQTLLRTYYSHVANLFCFRCIAELDRPGEAGVGYLVEVATLLLEQERTLAAVPEDERGRMEQKLADHNCRVAEANPGVVNAAACYRDVAETLALARRIRESGPS